MAICIIGAGLAGDTAAAALRSEGYEGRVLLIGDEQVPPYDRPPLSKEILSADAPPNRLFLRAESWYKEQDIELRLGEAVTDIDPSSHRLRLAGGDVVSYEKALLAMGSRARELPRAESATTPTFVVRTLDDAMRLREALRPDARVVIVGAGVIGLEVAASAIKRGCSVDVVDLADRVLSRVVPPRFSKHMAALQEGHGVRLHLAAGNVALVEDGVHTRQYGTFAADLIVVGIGGVPNAELAKAAGLACPNGVLVDEYCRTTDTDIYAAGDVACYPCPSGGGLLRSENWKHAQNHAAIAARNMLGRQERYDAVSSMWSEQFGMKLQALGHFPDTGEVVRGTAESSSPMSIFCDPAGVVVGAVGLNQVRNMRLAQSLIEGRVIADPLKLADPGEDLRKLARSAT